jgi:hypothetical protein
MTTASHRCAFSVGSMLDAEKFERRRRWSNVFCRHKRTGDCALQPF